MPEQTTDTGNFIDGYRNHLLAAEQKAQDDFDKTVLALAGGTIGISFSFVKDFLGTAVAIGPAYLKWSWVLLAFSVTAVLASFFFSQLALRHTIEQVDQRRVYIEHPGGWYSTATRLLNWLGALLFLFGLALMITFVYKNVK